MPFTFNLPVNANLGAFVLVDGEQVEATYETTNSFTFVNEMNAGAHHIEVLGFNDGGDDAPYTWTISGFPMTLESLNYFC